MKLLEDDVHQTQEVFDKIIYKLGVDQEFRVEQTPTVTEGSWDRIAQIASASANLAFDCHCPNCLCYAHGLNTGLFDTLDCE